MLREEPEFHVAERPVSVFADNDFGEPLVFCVLVVDLIAIDETDKVRILFNSPGFAEIPHFGALVGAGFDPAIQLSQCNDRDVEFFGDLSVVVPVSSK